MSLQSTNAPKPAGLTGLIATGVTALVAFCALLGAVLTHALVAFNQSVLMSIHAAMAGPPLDGAAIALTTLGSVPVMGVLTVLMMGVFVWRNHRFDAVCLGATMFMGAVSVEVLKHLFHQQRPALFPTIVHETGYSFPSGHSTLSFCFFGYLAGWLLVQGQRTAMTWLGAVAGVGMAAAIACSRLYLGVHWPSDVTAGALVATTWVCTVLAARQVLMAGRGKRA